MATDLHFDDALDFLIRQLRGTSGVSIRPANQYDVQLQLVAASYWQQKDSLSILNLSAPEAEPYLRPFLDAGWYLSRIGVLRPGEKAPGALGMRSAGFDGDGYSITSFGREWLSAVGDRPPIDPTRYHELTQPFADRFGPGFMQRAIEASTCYQTANYLASCAMAGAATESILLAIAIAKIGDEQTALSQYRAGGGRRRLINRVVGNVSAPLASQFEMAIGILSYWRDETAHGVRTSINETQAFVSLGQLLRLAQLAADHWSQIVSRAVV
jgi:hypothetical protein